MTADLVTYYGQTLIIEQLVDKYGVYLEKLDREDKLLLRMALANYVFMQEHSNPGKYTVEMALEPTFRTSKCIIYLFNKNS